MTVLHTPASVCAVVQPYISRVAIYIILPDLTMKTSTIGAARNYLFCPSKAQLMAGSDCLTVTKIVITHCSVKILVMNLQPSLI